jgi:PAS domain-containing protein
VRWDCWSINLCHSPKSRAISGSRAPSERSTLFKKQFSEVEDACALAQAMVDTVREPLIVLDKDLRVIAASRSFYVKLATNPDDSRGKHLYELGNGEWNIPRLRELLENIIPGLGEVDDYEVEHDFPTSEKASCC